MLLLTFSICFSARATFSTPRPHHIGGGPVTVWHPGSPLTCGPGPNVGGMHNGQFSYVERLHTCTCRCSRNVHARWVLFYIPTD